MDGLVRTPRRALMETAAVVAAIAAIGWFDYASGPKIAFSLFYLLPIGAAAWWMSPFTAWIAVGTATAAWFAADLAFSSTDDLAIPVFNAATRLVLLAGAVVAIGGIRTARGRERSQALRALHASESRFRSLIESTSDFVWEVDEHGRYTYCSPQSAEMLGYAPEELIGTTPFDLMPADEAARQREMFDEFVANPKAIVRLENANLHKSGREVVLETSALPVFDSAGAFRGYRGIDRDITDRKQAEQELLRVLGQLNQAQRLEAIGRLAGGIAHDFNNLLTIILGSADYLLESLPPGDAAREEATAILEAGRRAAKLTQQLLTFGRRQVTDARPVDLNHVLREMEGLLQRLIGEHIALQLALEPSAVTVNADPAQLDQVVANLAANARDAMPNGGKLTITTARVQLDRRSAAAYAGLLPGRYAMLVVGDTGLGIEPDVQQHLFEPFFTTKGRASGTGLGLATVHAIVEQSGGRVTFRSEVGKGSTFEILLPLIETTAEAAPHVDPQPAIAPGDGTLLVAEDEVAVRHLLTRYLRDAGYTVLAGVSAEDTIRLAAEAGKVDLLVTDVIMPGLSGPELASRLQATRPGLKVLYISGYPDGVLAQHGIVNPGTLLLQKPFSREALVDKVRLAIAEQGATAGRGIR